MHQTEMRLSGGNFTHDYTSRTEPGQSVCVRRINNSVTAPYARQPSRPTDRYAGLLPLVCREADNTHESSTSGRRKSVLVTRRSGDFLVKSSATL